MQVVIFLALGVMVLTVSWTFRLLLVGERLWVLFKSFLLAGCLASAHWSWPAFVGWQEVELRYDPRMNMAKDGLIFRASVVFFWSAWYIWWCRDSHLSLGELPEGTAGFPHANRRVAPGVEGDSQTPKTKRVPGLGSLLGLDISQWGWKFQAL